MDHAPAFRAVSTSTWLSPIITVCSGVAPASFIKRKQPLGIGFFGCETVAAINVQKVGGESQRLADGLRWTHRLICEDCHGARRHIKLIVYLVQRLERLKHAFVRIGVVQFVLAIVVEEELVRTRRAIPRPAPGHHR